MQEPHEIRIWCLGHKYPLEEEMATYSSIPAWEIPRTEKPGELQSMECKKSDMLDLTERTHAHTSSSTT